MKRILLGVAAAVSVLVIIVLGLALGQPDQFKVEREIAIAAQPAAVYANLDDFHRWEGWSPWEKIEPSMKKTYTGPATGTGSSYAWEGKEVGAGRMTITDSRPAQQLTIKLEFTKPFEATNTTVFELSPQGTDTKVRWIMTGQNNFVGKIMGVFADMDSMVGKDFEDGLRSLKRVSESS
jgi:carbon monoxide dehydrogenase subunit G